MSLLRFIASLCVLTLASTGALAQTASVGSVIEVGGRSIPLPQGRWSVVSTEDGRSSKQHPLARTMLAELDHNVLSRWVYISTNIETNFGGWKRNKEICDRRNTHFAYSDSWNSDKVAECWIVNHWGMTMGNNPNRATVEFYRWSDTLGRPNTSVGAAYFFVKNVTSFTLRSTTTR